jgi:hypothetical protein
MPEAALTEPSIDSKPIGKAFQVDALPEIYAHNAPGGDAQNRWCDVPLAKAAGLVNRYEHPGEAHTLAACEHADPMPRALRAVRHRSGVR